MKLVKTLLFWGAALLVLVAVLLAAYVLPRMPPSDKPWR